MYCCKSTKILKIYKFKSSSTRPLQCSSIPWEKLHDVVLSFFQTILLTLVIESISLRGKKDDIPVYKFQMYS